MRRAKDYAERAKRLLPEQADSEILMLLAELADFSALRSF